MESCVKKQKTEYLYLLYIFLFSIAIRIGLNYFISLPTIFYDELSYSKIARSLYYNLNTDFRGQSFIFKNILYPIIIAPTYMLKNPKNIYFATKLIGSITMSATIFPVYCISKELSNNNNKMILLLLSLLTVCIPDMFYTTKIMSEVLYYPLVVLCFLLVLKDINSSEIKFKNIVFLSSTFFLVYLCKAVGFSLFLGYIVFLIVDYLIYKKENVKETVLKVSLPIIIFTVIYLTYGFIFNNLNETYKYKDFYSNLFKNTVDLNFIKNFVYALFTYLFYSTVAFLIFPIIIPICNFNKLEKNSKRFALYSYITLAISICSIVYLIIMKEDAGRIDPRIHIRYIFPFFIIFCAIFIESIKEKISINKLSMTIFVFIILSITLINPMLRSSTAIDSPMLYYIYFFINKLTVLNILFKICVCTFITYIIIDLIVIANSDINKLNFRFITVFLIICIVNNVLIYSAEIKNSKVDTVLRQEVIKINNYFDYNKGNIAIIANNIYDNNIWKLESFLNKDYRFTSFDDCAKYIEYDGNINLTKLKVDAYIGASFNKNSFSNIDYIITDVKGSNIFENVQKINIEGVNNYQIYKIQSSNFNIRYIPSNIYSDNWIGENASIKVYDSNKEKEINLLVDKGNRNEDITMIFTDGTGKVTKIKAPNEPQWIKILLSKDSAKKNFELKFSSEGFFIPNQTDKNNIDNRKLSFRIIDIK